MGQYRPLFVYFRSFLIIISTQIEKSIDDVLGIRTRGRRMVGIDETTELWRPPKNNRLFDLLLLLIKKDFARKCGRQIDRILHCKVNTVLLRYLLRSYLGPT